VNINWNEKGNVRAALWRSERGSPPPRRVVEADERTKADVAYRLACEGTALLWRGDFQNARQLLNALARRAERMPRKPAAALSEAFHLHRQAQAQRARTLDMLLIAFEADHTITLPRAPDVRQACVEAYGESASPYVTSLRELLGIIGAHEWRKKGIFVPELGARIHPRYGVFAPVRNEYLSLVARAPLPVARGAAFDIGTGTGVIAALLARRGFERVVATDTDPRALACARENVARLGLEDRIEVVGADLFPDERAALAVCNPPWIPARPSAPIERAIFDHDSRMLNGFLERVPLHLEPYGEAWLIISDLAEHLGLRTRAELLARFDRAGLVVCGRLDARPTHPKTADASDPLHAARAAEVTSLWRLARPLAVQSER
jgi:methylase of polypeptide subunit release factors